MTSGRRKRDDHVGQTGASKKRQLEESSSNDAAARLRMADQTIHAQHEQISPANVPAVEQDKQIPENSVPNVMPTAAEATPNATEGQKVRNTLFALVSRNRLLVQKRKCLEESQHSFGKCQWAVATVEGMLQNLERQRDLMPVSEEHLKRIAEEKERLKVFEAGKSRGVKKACRLRGELDTLRSQMDLGIRGLHTYSDKLEEDPALHIFANREPFWKNLAALTTANTAIESVKARLKAIEDERLAISSQMDVSFEGDLKTRVAMANSNHPTVNAAESLDEANTGNAIEQYLRRLNELAIEAKDLEQAELFRELDNVESLSKELLRLAERAFIQAWLLRLDGSTVLPQEEGSGAPINAQRGHVGADPGGSPSLAASWGEEEEEEEEEGGEEEHDEPREEQASDQMHAQAQVSAHASEEANMPPLVIAASMMGMDIQNKFEEVRDDFRAKKKAFEEGKHRNLTQEDLAAYPHPLSEEDKGVLLVHKLQSHTEAYRLAEEKFYAWREVAVKYGFEPELPEKKATEIAPDCSDNGYPDEIFVVKKEKAGPKVQRWRSDARVRKSPSSASSQRSSVNTRMRDMVSMAFDEDVQDETTKSLWLDRINEMERKRQELRRTGPFENAENDFHPRNDTKTKRAFPRVERAASI